MTRFLLISILFLLTCCSSAYQKLVPVTVDPGCLDKFKPALKNELYGTQVDVIGKHISGLTLFKTLSDTSLHIVFFNEAGITFFDFEFLASHQFKVNHVIPALNKKPVIKTLRRDFELITMQHLGAGKPVTFSQADERFFAFTAGKETDYFVTNEDCSALLRIETGSKRKRKTEVRFSQSMAAPDSIQVRHFNFDMTISLKKLARQ